MVNAMNSELKLRDLETVNTSSIMMSNKPECSANWMFIIKILTLPKEDKRYLLLHHSLFKWKKAFFGDLLKKGLMFNTLNNRG